MLKKILILSLLVAQPIMAQAGEMTEIYKMPTGTYVNDPTHSSINWKVSHFGLSEYAARFTKFNAKLNFIASTPMKSTLEVTIDPTSIQTDYPEGGVNFNKKLAYGKEWFNAIKFPQITFKSTKIERRDDMPANTAWVYGDLSMLGMTRPIIMNVKFNGAYEEKPLVGGAALGFSANAKLNRSEWGFATYVPNIGDAVKVSIEIEFNKATN